MSKLEIAAPAAGHSTLAWPNGTAGSTGLYPDADLDAFVARLARRIASFPADAVRSAKRVLNDLTMPGADAIRGDARRFHRLVVSDPAKSRTAALFSQGLQTCGPLELDLGDRIGAL